MIIHSLDQSEIMCEAVQLQFQLLALCCLNAEVDEHMCSVGA